MGEIAIRINNVSKYYKLYQQPKDRLKEALHPFGKKYHKEFYALKGINLEIKKGEILGIVGKNGSGKSTLLKIITRVLTPSRGSIEVNGKISALLELGAGFNPEFTGLQNIYFYATILGLSKNEIDEKLQEIIDFAEIGEFIEQPIKTYSSGMKSRLGFAVAAHIDPEILILDEVLAVGDVLFKRKCYAKMEEFFKGGKTIIYVSHDANSINSLCTRAIFLDNGKMLLDGNTKTVTTYYQKYLFAKNENRRKIKKEIVDLHAKDKKAAKDQQAEGMPQTRKERGKAHHEPDKAFFIPDFTSKHPVEYKNSKVRIINPHIKTLDGRQVNALITNHEYIYTFVVKFGVSAQGVSFGTQIKDIKGTLISGAALHNADRCISVEKGDEYEVAIKFNCRLLAGVYYTNSGVSAIENSERKFLTRLVDAVVFKVVDEPNRLWKGMVNLNQSIDCQKIVP